MGWSQVGQLPFYSTYAPLFEEWSGYLIMAGGIQSPAANQGTPASPRVWRSLDAINWERVTNDDMNWNHDRGVGMIYQGKGYVAGGNSGANNLDIGKLTNKWNVTPSSSTKNTQVRWQNKSLPGGRKDSIWVIPSQITNQSNTRQGFYNNAAFMSTPGYMLYKKDITKGGQWTSYANGDLLPSKIRDQLGNGVVTIPPFFAGSKGGFWDVGGNAPAGWGAFWWPEASAREWWRSRGNGFQWAKQQGNLPFSNVGMACAYGNGTFYAIGGNSSSNFGREVWVSGGLNWSLNAELFPEEIVNASATFFNGSLYVAGGTRRSGVYPNSFIWNKVWKLS